MAALIVAIILLFCFYCNCNAHLIVEKRVLAVVDESSKANRTAQLVCFSARAPAIIAAMSLYFAQLHITLVS